MLFGKDPTLIRSRKARYTYGVRYSNPYVEGALDKVIRFSRHVHNYKMKLGPLLSSGPSAGKQ